MKFIFPFLITLLLSGGRANADIITGLEAHYTFDNAGDLGADSSGNGLTGTVNGGATGSMDVDRGPVLSLTGGADGNIEVAIGTIPGTGFTLATWVKSTSFLNNRGVFQVQNGAGPPVANSKPIGGWVNASGEAWGRVIQSDNTTRSLPQVGTTLSSGASAQWHHLAYRGNGSTYEVFIDGDNVGNASITYDGTILPHSHLFIGRQSGESWNGQLDDFRVYSRALSNADISDLFNNIPEPSTLGLSLLGLGLIAARVRRARVRQ